MKRPRGSGSIFEMKGSGVLWIKYHRNGKPIRESSHTTQRKKAEQLLRKRLAEISTGAYLGPKLGTHSDGRTGGRGDPRVPN
jgi:hypothetical protein